VLVAQAVWGAKRLVGAALGVVSFTWLLELVGSNTGVPFGTYDYSALLQPQIVGVPLVVPFAWFAMAIPAREVVRALGVRSGWQRVMFGAAALTAWDVFLDPQMVAEGYWLWATDGGYRGIPLTNYGGWMIGGAVVMTILEFALPHRERPLHVTPVVHYALVGVMETVAFALFFDDLVVAFAGAVAMLSISIAAVMRMRRIVSV
jgi:putative membrane protein